MKKPRITRKMMGLFFTQDSGSTAKAVHYGGKRRDAEEIKGQSKGISTLGIPQNLTIFCSFTTSKLSKKLIEQAFFVRFLVVSKNLLRIFHVCPRLQTNSNFRTLKFNNDPSFSNFVCGFSILL
jgi:hypothetical protein